MGLHRVDVGCGEPGVRERGPDHPLLRRPVRRGQPVGGAVLVEGGSADHGEHRVAVAAGVGESLDQHHADALGEAETVGVVGERLATAGPGQRAHAAETDERVGGRHHHRTTRDRHRALAGPQGPGGQVQRDQ